MGMNHGARVDTGPYWQLVSGELAECETPVHYAHLRLVQGATDMVGTLFLTTTTVRWRVIDPRQPEGASMDIDVKDLLAVDRDLKLSIFHGFRLSVSRDGAPEEFFLFPQHKNDADRMLSDLMFAEIEVAWRHASRAA